MPIEIYLLPIRDAKWRFAGWAVFIIVFFRDTQLRFIIRRFEGIEMGIQNWSENIVLVDLPAEPQLGDELKAVADIVKDRGDCDIVMDFSAIDIISSSSLSKLLKLRKQLTDSGHQLVFCNVAPATKGIFAVTGLEGIFKVVDDKFVALAGLQLVR